MDTGTCLSAVAQPDSFGETPAYPLAAAARAAAAQYWNGRVSRHGLVRSIRLKEIDDADRKAK
ncbi:hypothetical protein [Janthinobacterium sp. 1_2014MBL_MicDiv]|uniref:hypothetical protein n=1 Tax=Janthinobacterium sp. 1_2014MBL_MicDiv TaxID=1644131 RepID=UPI0008F52BB1|nr:hypothetical protein [Janthinobacterium sp. 1_2014MBL_MicDiv]APA68087.1 hypothetical protein YQ44_09860 [Janthinobacterium sp. 1_2014MBL_MicDiv]